MRSPRSRLRVALAVPLAVACLVAPAAAAAAGRTGRPGEPARAPAAAAVSAELPLAGLPAAAPALAPAVVAAAVGGPLADPALGGALVGEVLDVRSGATLWASSPQVAVAPASLTKLLTAAAALTVLGPADRPVTSLVTTGTVRGGVLEGNLVLRGGGDVFLSAARTTAWPARASVVDLAARLRAAGVTRVTGALVADGSAFSGPEVAYGSAYGNILGGSIAPVSGLGIDETGSPFDRGDRSASPARAAARALRAALEAAGVVVDGPTYLGTAPTGARPLAAVAGPPVAVSVEEMLQNSDNDAAEALGRRIALRKGLPATFSGAAQAISEVLPALGLPTDGLRLYDASGLSHADRVPTATLAALLRAAALPNGPAALRPIVATLAVGGFDGTVAGRYDTPSSDAGAGVVHAKTGALNGVTGLAGTLVDRAGRQLVFVFVTDGAHGRAAAEAAVDRAAAALAGL